LDEKCPECGSQLTRRHGRFGEFTSCSDFPKCKYIKKELKSTGIKCPECKEGDIVERRTHRRKIFYSCSRYPDCKYALWNKPNGDKCPTCGSLMVFGPKETVQCSNKECPGKNK
jgi:DNA topoisomerase-1